MNLVERAEIHFYQRDEVSLYLQSNSSDQSEKLGEIALGAFYAVRMMSNLGSGEPSEWIAMRLEAFPSTARELADRSVMGNSRLIEYPGYEGRRRSLLELRILDADVTFDIKPGVGYYAPASVAALELYLARRRLNDAEFLKALSTALSGCATSYRSGLISLRNHAQLVLPILARACPDYTGPLAQSFQARACRIPT